MAKARAKAAAKKSTTKAKTSTKAVSKATAGKSKSKSKATPAKVAKVAAAKEAPEAKAKPKVAKAPRTKPAVGAHSDLLRAILENPDDDRARIVYADALQEDGDPRGEFIALSLAEGHEASKRAKELLDAHRQKSWQNFGAKGARYTWRRGFIAAVGCRAKELVAAGPLMFEVEPITSISIYGDGQGQVATLVGFPLRVRHLSLALDKAADAEAIANAKTLGNLLSLELSSLGDAEAKILAASTAMPKLISFTASLGGLGAAGLEALVRGPLLANVTRLGLGQNNLDAGAMELIAAAPWASKLEALDLTSNPIGDAGVAALTRGPFGALRRLRIRSSFHQQEQPTLHFEAATALASIAKTTFAKLEELDLSWNIAGDALAQVKAAYGERLRMAVERFD